MHSFDCAAVVIIFLTTRRFKIFFYKWSSTPSLKMWQISDSRQWH
jgi:hypothetical protein